MVSYLGFGDILGRYTLFSGLGLEASPY